MSKKDSRKIIIVNTINDIPSNKQFFLLSQKFLENGYEVTYVTDNFKVIDDYKGEILHWKSKNFLKSCLFFISIIIKKKRFNTVILNFRATNYSFLFYFFSKKVILTLRSDFFPNSFFSKIKSSLKFIFADEIVTISNYMKEKLVKKFYFVSSKKITVFYNSIEVENFSSITKDDNLQMDFSSLKKIIFVGNLEYHKGFDLLIKGFINHKNKNLQLKIIGGGKLENLIPSHNESIIYLGRLSHQEVMQEVAQNHFIILPSRNEAFGQVIIEAMSVGTVPIIAKNIGASELINNFESGFLFDSVSEAFTFIEKMSQIEYDHLRKNVEIHKTNFDSNKWVNDYYDYIVELFTNN